MRKIQKDSTNRSVDLYIIDSTTGVPETGVLFNTAGMDLKYRRQLSAVVSVTEVTLAALTTAHADGGFLEIGNGVYRFDLPDAAWATGADKVVIFGTVTGMIILPQTIQLVDYDPEDVVRLGLTALPNAAAEAAGGLYTRGSGAGQINQQANGQIDSNLARWLNVAPLALVSQRVAAIAQVVSDKTGYTLTSAEQDAIVDKVWDEVLTGGTHNVATSAGRRLRELEDATLIRGDAFQAGSTTTSLVLDASASAVDNFYNHTIIRIIDGVAADQERIIADYNGTTKAVTITPALVTAAPASGDEFKVISGGSIHAETQGGGYEGGAVWIDTLDGVAGTLLYVNGTIDNPVDNIADARTLADALGMHVYHSLPGSSFTLAQAFTDFEFIGSGFTVALGGQDIGGSRFFNCAISGIGTGSTRIVFRECLLSGATTLPTSSLIDCNFTADVTLSSAGIYRITNGVHGSATSPAFDFGAAVANTTVHIHGYNGAVTVKNMGQLGTDVLHFDSPGGKLTLDVTCIGGTVNMNGTFELVDNSSGMTLNQTGSIIKVIGVPVGADISADIATRSSHSAANVWTSGTRTLTAISTTLALSIWDVLDSAILTAGSVGLRLKGLVFTKVNELDVNVKSINGNGDSPVILDRAVRSTTRFTVGAASSTTSIVTSSMDPAAAAIDQFKGLIVKFDKDTTTANLRGQGTDITGNTAAGVLTVTALTTAPVSGDTGTIE